MRKFACIVLISLITVFLTCGLNPFKDDDESDSPIIRPSDVNLGFEEVYSSGTPKRWFYGCPGYTITTDESTSYSGDRSLRMEYTSEEAYTGDKFGVATIMFPIDNAPGKTLQFTGYIKTSSVNTGYAGLWMPVDDENNEMTAFDNMKNRGIKGSTRWTKCRIELKVGKNTSAIYFGALLPGNGTAWFDNFFFRIL